MTKHWDDYDEKYMKIKFDSIDNLPLNIKIEIPIVTIVLWADFYENKNIIHNDFLMNFYMTYKNFPKELMLIKQVYPKECDVCHY